MFKHELTHFTFLNLILSDFFNEGIASFVGGSSSKCDQKCDYHLPAELFTRQDSDSLFENVLNRKYIKGIPFGKYFYPLESFTIYLTIKKYDYNFYQNAKISAMLSIVNQLIPGVDVTKVTSNKLKMEQRLGIIDNSNVILISGKDPNAQ